MPLATYPRRRFTLLLGVLLATAITAYALPLLQHPNNYFADDSYFYFQIAWNIARGMGSTFNGIMPTNGYHPLWMLCCVTVFKVLHSKADALYGIAGLILALDLGVLALLTQLLNRLASGMFWAAYLLLIPFFFLGQLGTEGALSGLLLTWLIVAIYRLCTLTPSTAGATSFALAGALAVLARLDNIFIVAFSFAAVFYCAPADIRGRIRRLMLLVSPVYGVLWGAYLVSNLRWFGTLQPISGVLKAHPRGEPQHFHLPSHTGLLAALIIVVCMAILARFRRDLFFRVIEVPFALGVLAHAGYIIFVMSSETHWTWYYTSWVLLAAVVLSRVMSLALENSEELRELAAFASIVLLAALWWKGTHHVLDVEIPGQKGEEYERNFTEQAHVHALLAFDKPGRMAYFSDVPIIALDGLVGDLAFQRTLSAEGIAYFDAQHGVDGFAGPPQPLNAEEKSTFCDHIYLSSLRLHCVPSGPGQWTADSVQIFSRLTGKSAGVLDLPPSAMVLDTPGDIAVWKLPTRQMP